MIIYIIIKTLEVIPPAQFEAGEQRLGQVSHQEVSPLPAQIFLLPLAH